jgi:hypothetical protein
MEQPRDTNIFGGVAAHVPTDLDCTAVFPSTPMNASLFKGSEEFKAMQLSKSLGHKIPPFEQVEIMQQERHWTHRFHEDPVPLRSRILKENQLSFQFPMAMVRAPVISSWWYPYDSNAIMRYGQLTKQSFYQTRGHFR